MISPMTTAGPQHRYDIGCGSPSNAPATRPSPPILAFLARRSGGLRTASTVVSLAVADLTELERRQEVLKLRRRVQRLAALLRLARVLLRVSTFTLSGERLPDGRDKLRIRRAIDQARACIPLRTRLRLLH